MSGNYGKDQGEYLTETYGLTETESGVLCVRGRVDGLQALRQAVYLMLNIEKGRSEIFSADYGVELEGLLGQRREYVVPELERRLREALCHDERVLDVVDFAFEFSGPRVHVSFVVKSVYGDFADGLEAMLSV